MNQYLYEIEPEEDDDEYYDSDFEEPDEPDEDAMEQAAFERSP